MDFYGVINFTHKWSDKWIMRSSDPIEETQKFMRWASAYKINIKDFEIITYDVPCLSKIAAEYEEHQINEFYKRIANDTSFWEYRNPINTEWYSVVWLELMRSSNCTCFTDPVRMESICINYMLNHIDDFKNETYQSIYEKYSVKEMCEIINGIDWTEKYQRALHISDYAYLQQRFYHLRKMGLGELPLTDDVSWTVKHSIRTEDNEHQS